MANWQDAQHINSQITTSCWNEGNATESWSDEEQEPCAKRQKLNASENSSSEPAMDHPANGNAAAEAPKPQRAPRRRAAGQNGAAAANQLNDYVSSIVAKVTNEATNGKAAIDEQLSGLSVGAKSSASTISDQSPKNGDQTTNGKSTEGSLAGSDEIKADDNSTSHQADTFSFPLGADQLLLAAILNSRPVREHVQQHLLSKNILCNWSIKRPDGWASNVPQISVTLMKSDDEAQSNAPDQMEAQQNAVKTAILECVTQISIDLPNPDLFSATLAQEFSRSALDWQRESGHAVRIELSTDRKTATIVCINAEVTIAKWKSHVIDHVASATDLQTLKLSYANSPRLAALANPGVVAQFIKRAHPALSLQATENEVVVVGKQKDLQAVSDWLEKESRDLSCRAYVLSHPLLNEAMSKSDVAERIGAKCDCIFGPRAKFLDFEPRPDFEKIVALSNGHEIKAVRVRGDISRQIVDVIFKPISDGQAGFKALFANLTSASARPELLEHDSLVGATESSIWTGAGLLFCKRVLYSACPTLLSTSAFSNNAPLVQFFLKCFDALAQLKLASIAIPVSAFGIDGDKRQLMALTAALAEALKSRFASPKALKINPQLREVRLVLQPEAIKSDGNNASEVEASPPEDLPEITIIDKYYDEMSAISTKSKFPTLKLPSGVIATLVQGDVTTVVADAIVTNTLGGSLGPGGTLCSAVFAAGGAAFRAAANQAYPAGIPKGMECIATPGNHGNLKCEHVIHTELPHYGGDASAAEAMLKSKVKACLQLAYGKLAKSIAIPTIGGGGLSYPPAVVAKGLLGAAMDWSANLAAPLKNFHVQFVVFNTDNQLLRAFETEFQYHENKASKSNQAAAQQPQRKNVPLAGVKGVKLGEIEVRFVNVAASASTAASAQRKEQVLIVPASDAQFAAEWLSWLIDGLRRADAFKLDEVSIPLLPFAFQAAHDVSPAYFADLIFAAVICLQRNSTDASPAASKRLKNLKAIYPFFESASDNDVFAQRFLDLATEPLSQGAWQTVGGSGRGAWGHSQSQAASGSVEQILAAFSAKASTLGLNDVKTEGKAISGSLSENSYSLQPPGDFVIYGKKTSVDAALAILSELHKPFISRWQNDSSGFGVKNLVLDDCIFFKKPALHLMGGYTNTAQFGFIISTVLAGVPKTAKAPSSELMWYVQGGDDRWAALGQDVSATVEQLYQGNDSEPRVLFLRFDFNQSKVAIGSTILTLKRKTNLIPINWISGNCDVGHQKIDILSSSYEYQDIVQAIGAHNLIGKRIEKIQRIENVPLHSQYLIQKARVESCCPNGHLVERNLFHGTSSTNVDIICEIAFDRSFAGSASGKVYGAGSYFARDFSYSASYARDGYMFFCKVLTGEFVCGTSSMKALPLKPNQSNVRYDCAVDNLHDPTIFVIFADCNAYPAYLIKFSHDLSRLGYY